MAGAIPSTVKWDSSGSTLGRKELGLTLTCLLGQGQDLSHKCHVSVQLWTVSVYLEMASSFYLRVGVCARCTYLRMLLTLVFTP